MKITKGKRLALIILFWSLAVILLIAIYFFSDQDSTKSNTNSMKIAETIEKYFSINYKGEYLRLVRKGNVITAYCSNNGSKWFEVGNPAELAMNNTAYIGIASTSYQDGILCLSEFEEPSIKAKDDGGTASIWRSTDIGKAKLPGGFQIKDNVYTIKGPGTDKLHGYNLYHFAYKPIEGDFEITVKLRSIEDTNDLAKAGIMLRESLDAGGNFSGVFMTPEGKTYFISKGDGEPYFSVRENQLYYFNRSMRKVIHFSIYFILGILLYIPLTFLRGVRNKGYIISIIVCTVMAVFDEFHQWFVPGRTALFTDVIIDVSGSIIGLSIAFFISSAKKKNISNKV